MVSLRHLSSVTDLQKVFKEFLTEDTTYSLNISYINKSNTMLSITLNNIIAAVDCLIQRLLKTIEWPRKKT